MGEYPVHQLARLGRLYRSFKSQHRCHNLRSVVLPLLVCTYVELNIKQNTMRKPLLIKQEPK